MTADPTVEKLLAHAEAIAVASERIEQELQEKIVRLRAQQRRTRLLGLAVAAMFALLLVGGFALSAIQRHQLRAAICATFQDVASSPVTPQTTDLGRRLIEDTAHGAHVAKCPKPAHSTRTP